MFVFVERASQFFEISAGFISGAWAACILGHPASRSDEITEGLDGWLLIPATLQQSIGPSKHLLMVMAKTDT